MSGTPPRADPAPGPAGRRGQLKQALRAALRTVAAGIAARVGRDALFEQPGERVPTPPLRPGPAPAAAPRPTAPRPPVAAPLRAPGVPADVPGRATRAELPQLRAALGPGGGVRVVNHWATWCIPCVEEMPLLIALEAEVRGQAAVFGVSWDLFDPRGDEEDIVVHVQEFARGHSVPWPSLVVAAAVEPPAFFAALGVRSEKVPQTWVLNDAGEVVERVEGAVDGPHIDRIRAAVARAAGAPVGAPR